MNCCTLQNRTMSDLLKPILVLFTLLTIAFGIRDMSYGEQIRLLGPYVKNVRRKSSQHGQSSQHCSKPNAPAAGGCSA